MHKSLIRRPASCCVHAENAQKKLHCHHPGKWHGLAVGLLRLWRGGRGGGDGLGFGIYKRHMFFLKAKGICFARGKNKKRRGMTRPVHQPSTRTKNELRIVASLLRSQFNQLRPQSLPPESESDLYLSQPPPLNPPVIPPPQLAGQSVIPPTASCVRVCIPVSHATAVTDRVRVPSSLVPSLYNSCALLCLDLIIVRFPPRSLSPSLVRSSRLGARREAGYGD